MHTSNFREVKRVLDVVKIFNNIVKEIPAKLLMIGDGPERHLAMAPSRLQQFIIGVQQAFENAAQQGELPVLITSPSIRPHVRAIIERFRPQYHGRLGRPLLLGASVGDAVAVG